MFLILTKLTQEYTKTILFETGLINVKDQYVIIPSDKHKLDITLTANGFSLLTYYLKTPKLYIDSNDMLDTGEEYIWLKNKNLAKVNEQLPKDVILITANPDTIVFNYDLNAIKYVPIHIDDYVTYAQGYDMEGQYSITPDTIKIVGPKNILETINKVNTEEFVFENVKNDIQKKIKIIIPDSTSNITYSQKEILVNVDVERFTEGFLNIPIDIVNVPKGIEINYFPKTVKVSYYCSLKHFESIVKQDFKVECNFNTLPQNGTSLQPQLVKLPNKVKRAKINQKQVELIIK